MQVAGQHDAHVVGRHRPQRRHRTAGHRRGRRPSGGSKGWCITTILVIAAGNASSARSSRRRRCASPGRSTSPRSAPCAAPCSAQNGDRRVAPLRRRLRRDDAAPAAIRVGKAFEQVVGRHVVIAGTANVGDCSESMNARAAWNSDSRAPWVRSPLIATRSGGAAFNSSRSAATTAGSSAPKCRSVMWGDMRGHGTSTRRAAGRTRYCNGDVRALSSPSFITCIGRRV